MKRFVLVGVLVALALSASAAMADPDDTWMVQFRAISIPAGNAVTTAFGTKPGASDDYTTVGMEDAVTTAQAVDGHAEIISTIVPGQRTAKDVRAPLSYPSHGCLVWDLSMYIVGDAQMPITLIGWVVPGDYMLDGDSPNVVLKQGSQILWTLPHGTSGTWQSPQFTQVFDYTGTPISLQLVAAPEPSSIVAMLSGILGIVGFGIRRRR